MPQTVLITGCSSGFGKLIAQTFAAQGWNVAATMRRPEAETDLVNGESMLVTRLDVTEPGSIDTALRITLDRFGGLSAVVNNAGYGGHFVFEQAPDEVVRAMFETNVFGTMNVCRAALPLLRAGGAGSIVNVTSMAGMMALPLGAAYSATKYALEGFTEGLAIDYRPFGITVRSVLPGAYPTAFTANTDNHLELGDAELVEFATKVRATMDARFGGRAEPQDPREVADLVYACATEDDRPTHNPAGADAQMLVGLMASTERDEFIDRIRDMFEIA
ncbi:MAG: SDR family oxidoreductase [Actinomycetota bacterium]